MILRTLRYACAALLILALYFAIGYAAVAMKGMP